MLLILRMRLLLKFIEFLLILQFLVSDGFSQNLKLGEWRSHLNYTKGKKCLIVKNKVYCVSDNGFFYVDRKDNSLVPLSKTSGFSDNFVQTLEYSREYDLLMIAYQNTLIDLLKGNTINSLPDIYRKSVIGKKTINHIYFYQNKAYISCSFGIVVYDISRNEIKESYIEIGENGTQIEVFATAFYKDSIFAATNSGILAASLFSPNLLDYRAWKFISSKKCSKIVNFQNTIYAELDGVISSYQNGLFIPFIDSLVNKCVNMESSNDYLTLCFEDYIFIFNSSLSVKTVKISGSRSAVVDPDNNLWIAHSMFGMLKYENNQYSFFAPNGPYSANCWDLTIDNNIVYVAPGSLTFTGAPSYNLDGLFYYHNGIWYNKNFTNDTNFSNYFDIIKIAVHPQTHDVYIGSFGNGMLVMRNYQIIDKITDQNSSLQVSLENPDKINIRGMCFDSQNQLWVSNFGAPKSLSVRKNDGTWTSYNLGGGKNRNIGDIVIDGNNRKWILLPLDGGIIVFDETRPPGNQIKLLSRDENNGNLPSERIHSIALDKKGRIWIGSEEGVAVFFNPSGVFSSSGSNASKIWVNSGSDYGYLLASEIVTAIAVDGANKKWLGSRNGVWYVSEDGSEIIYHFNKENSPLPSNVIRDIAVNNQTGEVFFATDAGLVSFLGSATEGGLSHDNVYAYPNPVRPEHTGPVVIRGLVSNANVKITDAAGNLVTEITAEGGQAIWNLKDISGNNVHSGVYLVFSSNEDGSETEVTKILIIR